MSVQALGRRIFVIAMALVYIGLRRDAWQMQSCSYTMYNFTM